jgi:hypothetical protein
MPVRDPYRSPQALRRCVGFWETLCRIFVILFNKRKTGDRCVYFPERIINRPDPCIYDQFLLMQFGLPVTWDNPDVAIFLKGVKQYTYNLTVNTTYDIAITVHNSSSQKPADNTQVAVRWVEFGAGGLIRHPIDNLIANVPVWPGTDVVQTKWTTPPNPGHYCIEVQLSHPNDANPANNLGWNNTLVFAAHSQAQAPVRIFNRWVEGRPPVEDGRGPAEEATRRQVPWNVVEVTVDSYVFHDAYGGDVDPKVMFAQRPSAWPARVEPSTFAFSSGEAYRDILLIVDAPSGPGHPENFNVTATQGGLTLGGVTVTVTRS